ncbi:MAG: SDR family oxidoreductase, partial [bacterium]|nr:SDR family oxidoreductase [bacterium]
MEPGFFSQAALLPVTEIDGESFAGRIHQRVRGAAVLAEALGDREPDFCLLISALSSVLGGVGMVADVAAVDATGIGSGNVESFVARDRLLPATDEWTAWLEEHGESDEISIRIRRILALEEHGARVLPIATDITDIERMKAVVEECVQRFGRLDGVIHASAEGGSQAALLPVTEIDGESFAGRIHQRVRGAAVLSEALGDREPDFCLLISSLSSVLGGVGMVADVAADCCLELLARSASRDAATVWRSILWDNEGDGAMRPEDGVAALQRLLCSQFLPCIAVSTVDLEARIDLRWAHAEPEKAGEAVASRRPRPQLESPYAAPEDELEEAICAIWEELFGIGGIGIDDDF